MGWPPGDGGCAELGSQEAGVMMIFSTGRVALGVVEGRQASPGRRLDGPRSRGVDERAEEWWSR